MITINGNSQAQAPDSFYVSGSSLVGNSGPRNPCVLESSEQLTKWISEAETHSDTLRGILFGEAESKDVGKQISPSNIAGIISSNCSRAASLCGALRTIISRLDSKTERQ